MSIPGLPSCPIDLPELCPSRESLAITRLERMVVELTELVKLQGERQNKSRRDSLRLRAEIFRGGVNMRALDDDFKNIAAMTDDELWKAE